MVWEVLRGGEAERELSSSPLQVGYAWRQFGGITGQSSSRAEQKLRGPVFGSPSWVG
jgi:hypothetical protein